MFGSIFSILDHEAPELTPLDQNFDFLFELVIVICVVPMIAVVVAVLGEVPLAWVCLHLRRPFFVSHFSPGVTPKLPKC